MNKLQSKTTKSKLLDYDQHKERKDFRKRQTTPNGKIPRCNYLAACRLDDYLDFIWPLIDQSYKAIALTVQCLEDADVFNEAHNRVNIFFDVR